MSSDEFVLTYSSDACDADGFAAFGTTLLSCRQGIEMLLSAVSGTRVLILTDHAVEPVALNLRDLIRPESGVVVSLYGVDSRAKDVGTASSIWEEMVRFRPEFVIGVGGGTISDLTGFTASTYRRGLPYALVPTTLLAMLDASIGGKTAIDVAGTRNAVGTMHLPRIVIAGADVLPAHDLVGLSEAVKLAMLYSKDLFDKLLKFSQCRDATDQLIDVVGMAAALKAEQCLNSSAQDMGMLYGHNIGYALERLMPIGHAEAVAIGIRIEGGLANRAGILSTDALARQRLLMTALSIDIPIGESCDPSLLIDAMKPYKLNDDVTARMVVPATVGERASEADGYLTLTWPDLLDGLAEVLPDPADA